MNAVKQWVAGEQIQGGRNYQEDDFSIRLLYPDQGPLDEDRLLLVLADGMGGHAGGAVASNTVVRAFHEGFNRDAAGIAERFSAGIETANNAVKEKQLADPNLSEMGCTLVAALIVGSALYWTSVGDSILWLFRQGRLERLNADHSMKPLLLDMVELGRMTEEEALGDSRINQLRSAIFGEEVPLIDMNADGVPLERGDLLLLATDGLETLTERGMTDVIKAGDDDAEEIVNALLDAVAMADVSGQDNTTALVYRVGQGDDSLHGALTGINASDRSGGFDQLLTPSRTCELRPAKAVTSPEKRPGGIIDRILHALTGKSAQDAARGKTQ